MKNKEKLEILKYTHLSSIDYNKMLKDIGSSVDSSHIKMETLLMTIIQLAYDIRFETDNELDATKVLENCRNELVNVKWKK